MSRPEFLEAAAASSALLRHPAVEASWTKPSALPDFSVGGLAAHLAYQTHAVPSVMAEPVPPGDPIPLIEHYTRAAWIDGDLDSETNRGIRSKGEDWAAVGPAAVASQVEVALDELRRVVPGEPADRVVHVARTGWSLTLDDYLVTRLLEIVVHSDDLAVSVGAEPPDLPGAVTEPVIDLLVRLSLRRHGTTNVLRALSRAERAPRSIAAI